MLTPTIDEQIEYRGRIRKLVRKIGREPEPDKMTFRKSEIKVIMAALACHDAAITFDMNRRKERELRKKYKEQKKETARDEKH